MLQNYAGGDPALSLRSAKEAEARARAREAAAASLDDEEAAGAAEHSRSKSKSKSRKHQHHHQHQHDERDDAAGGAAGRGGFTLGWRDPRFISVELVKAKLNLPTTAFAAPLTAAAGACTGGDLHGHGVLTHSTALSSSSVLRIVAAREDRRLDVIAQEYKRAPVRINKRLSPFCHDYITAMRAGAGAGAGAGVVVHSAASDDTGLLSLPALRPGIPLLPWREQLRHVSKRTCVHVLRQPMNTVLRLLVNVFLSVFVGLLFYQTGHSQQSVYARVGFLFFMTSIQAFVTVVSAVLTFTEERALFLREKQKHLYATSAYFLGRTAVDVVLQTVLAVVLGAAAYPMVGLQPSAAHFMAFAFCLVLTGQATHSYALVVGALVPYRTVALMLSPVVMVPMMMVTGFFANNSTLPGWLVWLQAISPQKFMFESMMTTEFTGLKLVCEPHELITVPLDDGTMERFCPLISGADILNLFSMKSVSYVANAWIVVALTVGVRMLAYAALRFSAWRHARNSVGG